MTYKIPRGLSPDQIIASYRLISPDTSSLDFSGIPLYMYKGSTPEAMTSFSSIFSSIPAPITELNLSSTRLTSGKASDDHALTPEEIARLFASIPKRLQSLDISFNSFGGKTSKKLTTIFQGLPPIRSLNLSGNDLGCRGYERLPPKFRIHPSKSLVDNLAVPLAALPKTLKQLDLGENNLGYRTSIQLASALGGIAHHLETLDLACNELDRLGESLAAVLAATPKGVKTLGLSENNLHRLPAAALATALASLPTNVEMLDLRWNDLSHFTGPELALIFAAIPRTIKILDLSGNNLNVKPSEELATAFAKLPAGTSVLFDESNPAESTLAHLAARSVTPPETAASVPVAPRTILLPIAEDTGSSAPANGGAGKEPNPVLRANRYPIRDTTGPFFGKTRGVVEGTAISTAALTVYRKPHARPSISHSFDLHCVTSLAGGGTLLMVAFLLWLRSKTSAEHHSCMYQAAFFATAGAALAINGTWRILRKEEPKSIEHNV